MDDVMIAYIGELMDAEVDRLVRKACRRMEDGKDGYEAINKLARANDKLAQAKVMADAWHSIKWVPAD